VVPGSGRLGGIGRPVHVRNGEGTFARDDVSRRPWLDTGNADARFSRTLRQEDYPDVAIVADKPAEVIATVRAKPGKGIWLFGGGSLFRTLLDLRLVDTIEVAVNPVLLGEGIPLLLPSSKRVKPRLVGNKVYKTGIISLEYVIEYGPIERGT
jgi:dihydrofolate reductase